MNLSIRQARARDIAAIYEISNDKEVRARSLHPEPIAWRSHVEWFRAKLRDPGCAFYVAVDESGHVFAQVRYDVSGSVALVGISLLPGYRSKGLGTQLLIRCDSRFFVARSEVRTIRAQIRPDNVASSRAFLRAGYSQVSEVRIESSGIDVQVYEKCRGTRPMDFDFDGLLSGAAPSFIVAELSANHHGSFEIAAETIRAIGESGADAVKVQTYTPDTITLDCDNEYFRIKQGTIWDGKTLHELYREAYMPWDWQPELKRIAESMGLVFFSAPFDPTAVELLERIDAPIYKIASFEITDIPLIELVASIGKPVIISTGIATLRDVEEALEACRRVGNERVALLKCTSEYPTPFSSANLRTIPNMRDTFQTVVGLSDHTPGMTAAIMAVTLGAKIIEKHFILDRKRGGPDASFSMEPTEFAGMVRAVRDAEQAMGQVTYELTEKVKKSREFSRSLFVVVDMNKGDQFSSENVRSIRPGFGMHPRHLPAIIGQRARVDIPRGTPLSWEMVESGRAK